MKKIFLIFALVFLGYTANSQSLRLIDLDHLVEKDFITTDPDSLLYQFQATSYGEISNISDKTIRVFSSMRFLEKTEGHSISYCTVVCYNPMDHDFVEDIQNAYTWEPGQSSNEIFAPSFQIYLHPYPPDTWDDIRIPGTTKIRLRFMNIDDPDNDFIEFDITYNITVDGVKSVTYEIPKEFVLYPNPSNNVVRLDIKNEQIVNFTNSKVKIYDLLGNVVLSVDNYNPSQDINISSLSSGRYIKAITDNKGKTYTLPLVVVD